MRFDLEADTFLYGLKLGEYPSIFEKTPLTLLEIPEGSKEIFLQGRRAERLGLGLGAAVYYRRVLEQETGATRKTGRGEIP